MVNMDPSEMEIVERMAIILFSAHSLLAQIEEEGSREFSQVFRWRFNGKLPLKDTLINGSNGFVQQALHEWKRIRTPNRIPGRFHNQATDWSLIRDWQKELFSEVLRLQQLNELNAADFAERPLRFLIYP